MPFDQEQSPLGLLLSRTYLLYRKKAAQRLQPYDITPEQFGILHQLSRHGGVSQKELARVHERDQTSIGKTLERLENKQLVQRQVDPNDRRAVNVHLTTKGMELLEQVTPAMRGIEMEINEMLTDEGSDQFIESINKIYKNLSG
ncbi:MarR family winged helix-turn-helix transcriptional regulator [Paenibacillus shenyangensis]|uniref:MarR family winged helix-turn-helix transcriptional regulator n=1 Tax=Paenibacillus sp. A9 TaxID=1284352 RepID=UPI00037C327E|nr:MarR family transcriptional regulator [Paenibacillus sp. A9]